jgi:hypothetical protein
MARPRNLECADNGGALDFFATRYLLIQSGVALRLPPHSKCFFYRSLSDFEARRRRDSPQIRGRRVKSE